MGTGRRESLGKQGRPERSWIRTSSAAGPAEREDKNINKKVYVIWVCVGV